MIKYVIIDLDGTLLYTLDSILYHLNRTLDSFGLSKITIEQCGEFIGNGARLLVKRAVAVSGDFDDELVERVLKTYNEAYNNDPLPHTYPYDGIDELVSALYERGIKMGVVTNKPEPTARQLVEHFFADRIAFVRGGRAGAVLKPDPRDSLDAIHSIGGAASECAFVGDTYVDIETGKNMQAALSVGVLWGFRTEEELSAAHADLIVVKPSEILDAVI